MRTRVISEGSIVDVKISGKKRRLHLVSFLTENAQEGDIGQCLLGKNPGDTEVCILPNGEKVRIEILSVG